MTSSSTIHRESSMTNSGTLPSNKADRLGERATRSVELASRALVLAMSTSMTYSRVSSVAEDVRKEALEDRKKAMMCLSKRRFHSWIRSKERISQCQ